MVINRNGLRLSKVGGQGVCLQRELTVFRCCIYPEIGQGQTGSSIFFSILNENRKDTTKLLSLTTNRVREASKFCQFWLWRHEDLFKALPSLHL